MNYTQLSHELAAHHWLQADLETTRLLLEMTERLQEGWLRVEDILSCPIAELQQVNQLWLNASRGQFGFSVQQQIWQKVDANYTQFGEVIGWRHNDAWLDYEQLQFSSDVPIGHLPALKIPTLMPNGDRIFSFVLGRWRVTLLQHPKLRNCESILA